MLFLACGALLAPQVSAQEDESRDRSEVDLDAIVVTGDRAISGTKTDTKLTEIPQSISVVNAEQFTDRAAVDLQDVFRYSAGVATELNGVDVRSDSLSARGFATVQYLDGLNRMPDFIYGARMEIFTIERAEVLRGPSAVLYGAGGAGGLFNAISKLPDHQFGGEVGMVLGNNSRRQLQLDVKGGLSDTVAARFVGLAREGQLQPEFQDDDRMLAMPSVTWSPGLNTDITLVGLYQKDDMGTQTYVPLSWSANAPSPDRKLPRDFFVGEPNFNRSNSEYQSAALLVDHRFGTGARFSSRTRYYEHEVDYAEVYAWGRPLFVDPEETLMARSYYILDEGYRGLNSDNNVAFGFSTGAFTHEVLLGVDYTLFKQDRQEGFGATEPLDLLDPQYGLEIDAPYVNAYTTRSTQLGFYAQNHIRYADRVSLLLGVRRDKATSEVSGVSEPDTTATTFRVGLIGEIGAGVSPYVSYSESFLPVFGGDYYGNPFQPREGRQYEAGIKWEPNPATLLTLSVYDIKESNYVVQDPDFLQNFIQTGQVGSKGVEVEANVRLGGVDINAAYSYVDAEILSSTTGTEGHRVINLPDHQASVWASKSISLADSLRLRFGGGVRYTGDKIETNQVLLTDPVTLADAMAELEYQDWRFSINVSNLFDKEFYAFCTTTFVTDGSCYSGTGRTFLATVRYLF